MHEVLRAEHDHLGTREGEKAKVKGPTCKGTKVVAQLGGFMAQTNKKS